MHGSVFDGKGALDVVAVPLFGLDDAVPAIFRREFDDWDLVLCESDVEATVPLLIPLVAFREEVDVTVLWAVGVK